MDDDELAAKMTALARSFPCLRGAPGVSPWGPTELNRWACGPASHGVARCHRPVPPRRLGPNGRLGGWPV